MRGFVVEEARCFVPARRFFRRRSICWLGDVYFALEVPGGDYHPASQMAGR